MTETSDQIDAILPLPSSDWICRAEVAREIEISPKTASNWSKAGLLRQFEHGFRPCGRRLYSRELVRRARERRWAEAIQRQDAALEQTVDQGQFATPRQ